MPVVTFVPGSVLHAVDLNASFAGVLPLEGGTLTGALEINPTPGSPFGGFIVLVGPPGAATVIAGKKGDTLPRWVMAIGDDRAESGSNAGSDFVLDRYADNGAFLGEALYIKRSTGQITIDNGALIFASLPPSAANDAAAAVAGVPLGGMYRNGSALMVRVA